MRVVLLSVLFVAALLVGERSQAQSAVAPEPSSLQPDEQGGAPPVIEEILVTGEQPGPGLWKATRDGKTLWILGMHAPLPLKMTWRSDEVESIIAESGRVVRWVTIETDIEVGFFARLAALPALLTMNNNPGGARLEDVLTPEVYERWQTLKSKYMDRDRSIEKKRPAFAAMALREKALESVGLSSSKPGSVIWPAVRGLARKHRVETLEPEHTMSIKVEEPRAVIKRFRETRLADTECFTQTLARLESDLDAMRTYANAWATGNMDVLRQVPPPDPSTDCWQMLISSLLSGSLDHQESDAHKVAERARLELERALEESQETWLRTVEDALREHSTVFAVVPVSNLFDMHGPLQALRERGYEVDEP